MFPVSFLDLSISQIKMGLFTFITQITCCKVRVRLELAIGVFSYSNILKMCPVVNPKVSVRLILGCCLN